MAAPEPGSSQPSPAQPSVRPALPRLLRRRAVSSAGCEPQLAAAEHARQPDPERQRLQAEGEQGQLGMEPVEAGLGPLAAGEDGRGSRGTAGRLGAENPAKRPWSPRWGGRSSAAPQEKHREHRAQLLLALLPGDVPLGASSSSRGQRPPSQSSPRGSLEPEAQGRAVAGPSRPRLGSHHQPHRAQPWAPAPSC